MHKLEEEEKITLEQAEDTPTNTIRDIDDVEFCDRSTMKFYALPIETVSLASDEAVKIVKKLDIKEKNNIFKDVVKAIRVLHEWDPPMYLRAIMPEAFLLCKGKKRYTTKLAALPMQKPHMICSVALLSLGISPSSRNLLRSFSWLRE